VGAAGAVAAALVAGRFALSLMHRRRAVRIRGATAIVCGASRGLGRAIVLELARRGIAKVGICSRNEEDLREVAALLVAKGIHVVAEACDLSNEQEAERFIGNACARLGQIDILVTNAATIRVVPAAALTKDDIDEAMASIFYTTVHPVLAVIPEMRQRHRGTIAIVTSIGARVGVPHLAPYCAAKFATMGLAESLRGELARDGISIVTAVPGLMRTGSHVRAEFKGDHEMEYAWFGASATSPIVSIDADRAARRIVSAIARGDVEVAFTPEARVAPIVRTLTPRLWAEIMELTARFLPRATGPFPRASEKRSGLEIERTSDSALVGVVRRRGRKFAERHGQIDRPAAG
jgi:NAD(P)-dependent dehydrogenase (short-subunit alcohol dehydrogenase family)